MDDRNGFDWFDKFNALQRLSFILGGDHLPCVRKVNDSSGGYVDYYEAVILVDDMQSEINVLREQVQQLEDEIKVSGERD